MSVVAPLFSGCGAVGADGSLAAAQVRFVQISPGATTTDFYVNGAGAAYGLGFESFTSYLPVMPGAASMSANLAGSSQVLANVQGTVAGGHQYTVVLGHALNAAQEHVYEDQIVPAPVGQVSVRVLNEVTGASALKVHVTPSAATAPVTSISVPAGGASTYINLPATGSYLVTAATTDAGVSFPIANVTVRGSSGAVRTVVFGGNVAPGTHTGVVGFSLDDVETP